MESGRWRKSSLSGEDTACVEVAHTLDTIRDSKHPAAELTADVAGLTAAIRRDVLLRRQS